MELLNDFSTFPLWKKALIVAGLPLVIIFILIRSAGTIAALLNASDRERTDSESEKIDEKIQANASEIARAEGRVEQLQENKNEAIKDQNQTDAVSFHNSRNKPSK